jgi:RNase P subunit RPR2
MKPLKCLVGRHQWHNGWDDYLHQVVWTCKRCGKTRRPDEKGNPMTMDPGMGASGGM